jgi:shikimate kinase
MRRIVLIGFMGTGKTVVGQALAAKSQMTFVDTDSQIEQHAKKTISQIFAEEGEPAFRMKETVALERLIVEANPNQVLSTGGGIVLAEHNWPLLRQLGDVVCLRATPETIVRRVGKSKQRPLLVGSREEVYERILALLQQRESSYAKADWACDTDQLTVSAIVDSIIQWQETNGS